MNPLHHFINTIPKAELHLHIEGSLEPELMLEIAKRNRLELRFDSVDELKKAYEFSNLQEFLDIYYEGANVLLHEQDFYDMTWAYLEKVHSQNVVYVEIFFDPQTHTDRGIDFDTVVNGIYNALRDAQIRLNIHSKLIMCFVRHLDETAAFATLEMAMNHRDKIYGVGLDSSELGNPPALFERVFEKARNAGFVAVAHAGEEGPAAYVWEALNLLKVARIDHGNRCLDDENLVKELVERQMALTVCPLSNLKLRVVKDLADHPIRTMLEKNLLATINSDDPAYFGGYVNENFSALADAVMLSKEEIATLVRNGFKAAFLDETDKLNYLMQVDKFIDKQ